MESKIKEKIQQLEQELNRYQEDRQKELDIFMLRAGIIAFDAETKERLGYLRGQIDVLKTLLLSEDSKD